MDFRQLEAFITVAKLKNFSKAGKSLFLSQPTISLHISNLERELSVVLFDRTSKEVNLTPAGKEFLNYALDMINMKNRALHNLSSIDRVITGTIHISTSSSPNIVILPSAIEKFSKIHPEVNFMIEEKGSPQILEDICSLSSEIGIVTMKVEHERFISKHLYDDDLVFICSKDLPIDPIIDLNTLSNYKLINRSEHSATRSEFERKIAELGHNVNHFETAVYTDNFNQVFRMVDRGIGVSYISKSIYECYKSFLNIKEFQVKGIQMKREVHLLLNKRRTLSPAVEDFVDLLLSTKVDNCNN